MTSQLNKDIERFTSYFRKQLLEIQALKTEHAELYQRLLYSSLLDTLAGVAFPQESTNRDRFVFFLRQFCIWTDGDKVSISHLAQLLQKNLDSEFSVVRDWATGRLNSHPAHDGEIVPINHDPSIFEIKSQWPTQREFCITINNKKIQIEHLKHLHLLYAYRNTLVHEFRTPGYGIEVDDVPYYHLLRHSNADGNDIGQTIELVYPHKFLFQLCDAGLTQLALYFSKNKLSPYDSRKFGTYWINGLNN